MISFCFGVFVDNYAEHVCHFLIFPFSFLHPSITPTHPVPCSLSVIWPSFHSLGFLLCILAMQISCHGAPVHAGYGRGGVSHLRNSNSAPSIGTCNHHRHSLQPLYSMSSDGQIFFNVSSSRRNICRSSFELYASSGTVLLFLVVCFVGFSLSNIGMSAHSLGPDIDVPEGRKKFLGLEPPTAASQTQDTEEEDVEERDGGLPQPISIRLSHPDTNSVTTLPAHSMPTSEKDITGDISSIILFIIL